MTQRTNYSLQARPTMPLILRLADQSSDSNRLDPGPKMTPGSYRLNLANAVPCVPRGPQSVYDLGDTLVPPSTENTIQNLCGKGKKE